MGAYVRLIGLHARAQAGKDTAFEILSSLAPNVKRGAFADPLKLSAMASVGLVAGRDGSAEQILDAANRIKDSGRITITYEDPRFPAKALQTITFTGRQWLQWHGTEGHRDPQLGSSFGEDFWVDNLLPVGNGLGLDWEDNFPGADVAVVTDVRFPNEAKRILDLSGEVWYIDVEERLGSNPDAHDSEQKLDDSFISKTLDNNGSLDLFRLEVKRAFNG